ncbi:hypothetical protein PL11201_440016 [Planktothrix sp. PCC 11201]|nr:hypothetical protein PL11201_440016 [Planktothrix sp. PCC 11201]
MGFSPSVNSGMPYPIRSEPVELLRVLFYLKTVRLAPMNLLPTAGGKLELCSRTL